MTRLTALCPFVRIFQLQQNLPDTQGYGRMRILYARRKINWNCHELSMLLRNNGPANPKCNNISAVCKSVNAKKNTLALHRYAWANKMRRQRGNRHNLPPLRSPRRKNKTWKVQCVCVSKRKLMAQNLHWSTAWFHVRVFSPTLSGQNRWLQGHLNWFLGREWRIPYVWKNTM